MSAAEARTLAAERPIATRLLPARLFLELLLFKFQNPMYSDENLHSAASIFGRYTWKFRRGAPFGLLIILFCRKVWGKRRGNVEKMLMALSFAVVRTENASRYLQQLCKHFAHKIPTTFTAESGECRFVCGVARMQADQYSLRIDIEAPDDDRRAQTQSVIESHLLRFAFREELAPLTWQEKSR